MVEQHEKPGDGIRAPDAFVTFLCCHLLLQSGLLVGERRKPQATVNAGQTIVPLGRIGIQAHAFLQLFTGLPPLLRPFQSLAELAPRHGLIGCDSYSFVESPQNLRLARWFVFALFDRQTFMIFTPGQVRVRQEIGGEETVYDTTGITFQKQRSDLFRHWILGLGSGDTRCDRHCRGLGDGQNAVNKNRFANATRLSGQSVLRFRK